MLDKDSFGIAFNVLLAGLNLAYFLGGRKNLQAEVEKTQRAMKETRAQLRMEAEARWSQHDRDFGDYKEAHLRETLKKEDSDREMRHELQNRMSAALARIELEELKCADDRRELAIRIAKIEP